MEIWVNPIHDQPIGSSVSFDFPANTENDDADNPYYADADSACYANVDFETPALEAVHGLLGVPGRPQAQPCMYEAPRGAGDPTAHPHDQCVDFHHELIICHTARLSGSFIPWLLNPNFFSRVNLQALPETITGAPIELQHLSLGYPIETPLTPVVENSNVWFWRHPDPNDPTRPDPNWAPELLMTVKLDGKTCEQHGLLAEQLYKLMIRWSFWACCQGSDTTDRLPIGGFTESETFQVVSRHSIMPD